MTSAIFLIYMTCIMADLQYFSWDIRETLIEPLAEETSYTDLYFRTVDTDSSNARIILADIDSNNTEVLSNDIKQICFFENSADDPSGINRSDIGGYAIIFKKFNDLHFRYYIKVNGSFIMVAPMSRKINTALNVEGLYALHFYTYNNKQDLRPSTRITLVDNREISTAPQNSNYDNFIQKSIIMLEGYASLEQTDSFYNGRVLNVSRQNSTNRGASGRHCGNKEDCELGSSGCNFLDGNICSDPNECAMETSYQKSISFSIDASAFNFTKAREFRDNLLKKYKKGRNYINYYYTFSKLFKLEYSNLLDYVQILPALYSLYDKAQSPNFNGVLLDNNLHNQAMTIIQKHRDVNNEEFQKCLDIVSSDLNAYRNIEKSSLLNRLEMAE